MSKRLLYQLATVCVLVIGGCSGDSSAPPGAAESALDNNGGSYESTTAVVTGPVVLFFGDSITAGLGVDPDSAFPALLQKRADSTGIEVQIVNAGSSGETSAGGLRRLSWVLRRHVDVLVIELGGNDGLRGVDLASTRENLQGIVDQGLEANPDMSVVIAGMMMPPNLGQEYTESFRRIYPELASANDAVLIPFLLDGIGGVDSLMQNDQIHPNESGHALVADLVWPYLLEALEAVPVADSRGL